MAKISDLTLRSTIVMATTGVAREMMVVYKNDPDEVWLLSKASTDKAAWGYRNTACSNFKGSIASSISKFVTKVRLMSESECDGKGNISSQTLSAIKNVVNAYWWTDTEYNSSGAIAFNKYGTHNHTKTNAYEIHPLVIINGSGDISGITVPPKTIPAPTISPTSYEYDGNSHEPTINYKGNEDKIATSKSYTGKQSAVGTYTITFTLKDTTKYNWSDNQNGATAAVTRTWEIKTPAITNVPKPMAEGTSFAYNGSPQKFALTYDEKNVTIVLPSDYTNVGRYMGIFRLKDKSKTQWIGGGTDDISFIWEITGIPITSGEISQKGTLTYNGKEQTPKWNNYDSSKMMIIDGYTSGIDAGIYKALFAPKPGYTWADGTTEPCVIKWIIEKKAIKLPTLSFYETTYNEKPQEPDIDYHGNEELIKTTRRYTLYPTDAGNYCIDFLIKDPNNYKFIK